MLKVPLPKDIALMKTPMLVASCVVLGLGFGIGMAVTQFGSTGGGEVTPGTSQGSAHDPPPVAYVENDTYDFGNMEVESSLEHTFTIVNRGGSDLTLRRGDTTCKCTMSKLNEERIAPGESAEINLEWKAETTGPRFRQTAKIHTNDPQQEVVTLTIEGDIRHSLQAYPHAEVVFATLHPHVADSQDVDLYAPLLEDLEVTGYEFSRPELSEYIQISHDPLPADDVDLDKGKSAVRIAVTVMPEMKLGNFRTILTLQTNHPQRPTYDLELRGNVDRGITIFGKGWKKEYELLDLRTISRSSGLKHKLTLWIRGPARNEANLEVITREPDFVQVTLGEAQPTTNGSAVRIPLEIVIPPGVEPTIRMGNDRGGYGEILIDTHHEDLGHIRIPLRFAVK